MERHKQWTNMGAHAKKACKIIAPYCAKNTKGAGYIVYAPAKKKTFGGLETWIMSAVKKCANKKDAELYIEPLVKNFNVNNY